MEEKQQSVILKIGSDYYSLTPAEKRLADFILANQEKVTQLSISELARASSVAEARSPGSPGTWATRASRF